MEKVNGINDDVMKIFQTYPSSVVLRAFPGNLGIQIWVGGAPLWAPSWRRGQNLSLCQICYILSL